MKEGHAVNRDDGSSNENAETPEQRRIRTGWLLSRITRDRRQRRTPARPASGRLVECPACTARVWRDDFAIEPLESCPACKASLHKRAA